MRATVHDASAVEVYHSRYRYRDRSAIHRRVIDRFKAKGEPALLIATQVAEMSLDLSADLLVTDIAPIPALIQRMGRLNRRARTHEPKPAVVCALPGTGRDESAPYEPEELAAAERWLDAVRVLEAGASQSDLARLFGEAGAREPVDLERAAEMALFFGVAGKSGVWRTRPGKTRTDGYTVTVVLDDDLRGCGERRPDGTPTAEWLRKNEVSIPAKPEVLGWRREHGVFVAPRERVAYDFDEESKKGTGARWRER